MVVLASAGGNTVAAIARLVQADEDSVRQVISGQGTSGDSCSRRSCRYADGPAGAAGPFGQGGGQPS